MEEKLAAFQRILELMDELRAKCPWDRKQTMMSLRNLTIEETYELADSIINGDMNGIKEELGDLLLHMVFYCKIAEEKDAFTIADALDTLCEKMIRRHPHIYGDVEVGNAEDVKKNWEMIKMAEKGTVKKSVLGGVPRGLPALVKAYRMQDKTAQVGFEWETTEQVYEKVEEELAELKEAIHSQDQNKIEEEYGDVLFALVNYGRFLKVDPETALEKINKKFKYRFEYIESKAPKPLDDMSLEEMDALWNEAKNLNKT